jgi:hypothetical protein
MQHCVVVSAPFTVTLDSHNLCSTFFKHEFSTEQTSNAALVSGLIIAEGVVETAQAIFEGLPECGGFFTGDACSAFTTPAKIIGAVVISGARIVRLLLLWLFIVFYPPVCALLINYVCVTFFSFL